MEQSPHDTSGTVPIPSFRSTDAFFSTRETIARLPTIPIMKAVPLAKQGTSVAFADVVSNAIPEDRSNNGVISDPERAWSRHTQTQRRHLLRKSLKFLILLTLFISFSSLFTIVLHFFWDNPMLLLLSVSGMLIITSVLMVRWVEWYLRGEYFD